MELPTQLPVWKHEKMSEAPSSSSSSSSSSQPPVSWPLEQSSYRVNRKIGKGAFSVVNYGVCVDNKMKVAIKCIDLETISTGFDDILMEVQTMRLCAHENVLKCYCSFVASSQLWLVTEYLDKGSCYRVMAAAKQQMPDYGEGMNEEWLAYILQQTLQGRLLTVFTSLYFTSLHFTSLHISSLLLSYVISHTSYNLTFI